MGRNQDTGGQRGTKSCRGDQISLSVISQKLGQDWNRIQDCNQDWFCSIAHTLLRRLFVQAVVFLYRIGHTISKDHSLLNWRLNSYNWSL